MVARRLPAQQLEVGGHGRQGAFRLSGHVPGLRAAQMVFQRRSDPVLFLERHDPLHRGKRRPGVPIVHRLVGLHEEPVQLNLRRQLSCGSFRGQRHDQEDAPPHSGSLPEPDRGISLHRPASPGGPSHHCAGTDPKPTKHTITKPVDDIRILTRPNPERHDPGRPGRAAPSVKARYPHEEPSKSLKSTAALDDGTVAHDPKQTPAHPVGPDGRRVWVHGGVLRFPTGGPKPGTNTRGSPPPMPATCRVWLRACPAGTSTAWSRRGRTSCSTGITRCWRIWRRAVFPAKTTGS